MLKTRLDELNGISAVNRKQNSIMYFISIFLIDSFNQAETNSLIIIFLFFSIKRRISFHCFLWLVAKPQITEE